MYPVLFRSDLDRKPEVLMNLAKKIEDANPWAPCGISATDRIIFLGTGIDDYVANIINAQLLFLESVDANKDIQIIKTDYLFRVELPLIAS